MAVIGETRPGPGDVLGLGVRGLLEALGVDPFVFHLTEGHSAFLTFELAGS